MAALTANRQVDLLEQQARQFHPKLAVLYDRAAAGELRLRLSDTDIRVAAGPEGLLEAATLPEADTVVTAVMGSVGLEPTLAAIREKKRIALANKETLVCAGELVMAEAERCGAEIVPVDSEHSAIFQSLQGCRDRREVKRLLLTCSGGPFFGLSHEELEHKTPADALKHPNWSMGAKITIDSATLMNKGLEIIEAMRLYRLPVEQVEAVIHRQSIVHSLVEYRDGAMIAQLGTADMKLPIRYAFTWPYRAETPDRTLDLLSCGPLTFQAPDTEAFPCLALARQCARTGGTGVHPESYPAAEQLLTLCGYTAADVGAAAMSQLPQKVRAMGEENTARQIGVGVPTLQDVVKELVKPGRDVRDDLPAPILRTDVLDIKDLRPGMELTGTVRNVVDFGVFVDIGVHQDGLVHISQICDRFIKHPSQAVAVGDVVKVVVLEVDEKKHRISLSMRQAAGKK